MNQVIYGDEGAINELVYGSRSDALITELKQQISIQNPMLTEQGRLHAQHAHRVFEEVSGWDVVRAARRAVAAAEGYVQSSQIALYETVEQFQMAPPRQQRWIMAHPETRRLFQAGRIDGYSESYVDIQPDAIGRDHYDYSLAIHGVTRGYEFVKEDGEVDLKYENTQIKRDLASWDEPLSQRNILDIARLHQVQDGFCKEGGDDFTSRFGGTI